MKFRTFKRRLIQFLLWFYPRYCDWHEGDSPVSWDDQNEGGFPSCPNCGLLLHTKDCLRCGGEFLDFSSRGGDDVMASPVVDESGDLCCSRCYRPEEPDEDEDYGQFDDIEELITEVEERG